MSSLTAMDMIVLLLVGGGAVLGIIRGFVTEVIALFAWVAAIAALKFFYTPAATILSHWVSGSAGGVLAFALVFGIVFIAGKLIASSLGARVRNSVLGPIDRGLGLGFGALKGLIVATLGFLLINIAYDTVFGGGSDRPLWMSESRSFTLLEASSRAIVDFVEARRHPKGDKAKSAQTAST